MGTEEASVEGVAGCLRRKSVRISPPLAALGCGSEMFPNEEPLCRRFALWRRAARRHTLASVRNTPAKRPGKNPTRTAMAGNLLQYAAAKGVVPFEIVIGITDAARVLVEDVVGDELLEDGEDEDAGSGGCASWSAFMMHCPLVLQV